MKIIYSVTDTIFGKCLIGVSENKVCFLSFVDKTNKKVCEEKIIKIWPDAELKENNVLINKFATKIFKGNFKSEVLLKGSDFEKKVWKALLEIPYGETVTYKKIASLVGSPNASRAVGTACGKNHIPYIIPCHRVLATNGKLGGYNGGLPLKQKMLHYEMSHILES